jgi:Protein of unknown function (DUF1838)
MIYHALESWDHLPERIKKVVKEKFPLYQTAPGEVDPNRPNATSWTYYAEEMKKRQK